MRIESAKFLYKDYVKMSLLWYVLHSKPNKEETLWREACARGLIVFYPRIKVRPVNPRGRKVQPYFPGYMFVQVDLPEVGSSVIKWMPYSQGLICCGGEPASLSDALIYTLQQRVEQINAMDEELSDPWKSGDPIIIQGGPFSGYEAIFDARLPGSRRVRVLLELVNRRQIPLELSAGQMQRKTM
jgi:transcription antitermination factor NusG